MNLCWKEPENGNKHIIAIPISIFDFPIWENHLTIGKPFNYSVLSYSKHRGILNHVPFPQLCIENTHLMVNRLLQTVGHKHFTVQNSAKNQIVYYLGG